MKDNPFCLLMWELSIIVSSHCPFNAVAGAVYFHSLGMLVRHYVYCLIVYNSFIYNYGYLGWSPLLNCPFGIIFIIIYAPRTHIWDVNYCVYKFYAKLLSPLLWVLLVLVVHVTVSLGSRRCCSFFAASRSHHLQTAALALSLSQIEQQRALFRKPDFSTNRYGCTTLNKVPIVTNAKC